MSKARFDNPGAQSSVAQVRKLLLEAQEIIDTLNRPDIGARLQEVIDAVQELA